MEILRLNNTTAIQYTVILPEANTEYTLGYEDLDTGESYETVATTNSNKSATFTLDNRYLKYTGALEASIYKDDDSVYNTGIEIVRPYCDLERIQRELEITPSRARMHEKAARKIIEATVGFKFTLQRVEREYYGMGTDYLPVYDRIQKLYSLKENGILVYDITDEALATGYKISIDRNSIIPDDDENKLEYSVVWDERYSDITFPSGFDYIVDADFGYRVIPEDIQEACEILVQDIEAGNLKYYMANIAEFDNREFKIKYTARSTFGTGNNIVDSILREYKAPVNLGVL